MLKLIFFTTNRIKLAHARHMAEDHSVEVESFRRKTFYASYTEPMIDSREELLEQSYESALEQANNSGINTNRRFFFLEDTSVIIDALSTPEREIPGVNIKYWMRDISFEAIDSILTRKSNRNVSVRSDILLHIPSFYQKKWRIEERYIVFVGVQKGTIVEAEYTFETNLIFPWLDNKTFNKWFVPIGESKPISCLPIEKAEQYDFRRLAFSQMMEFLSGKGIFDPSHDQYSLDLGLLSQDLGLLSQNFSETLILCGFSCAGKTTLSQYLVTEFGYIHIEASDFMYLNFYLRHDVGSGIRISDFAEEALKQKPEIAAQKIAEYMESLSNLPVVISGFRSQREVEWLKKHFECMGVKRHFLLGYIEASQETRFERYNKRNRDGQEITAEQFQSQDEQQIRMGLQEIALFDHKQSMHNEGTLNEFFKAAESLLIPPSKKLLPNREIDFSIFKEFNKKIGLEEPIFMALLSKWENGEDHEYFTTTEISKLINELFPSMKAKFKDNVSRYFNQDFYAFYEISPDPDENTRRYRLSNTGFSRAVSIYYKLRNVRLS